MSFALLLLSVGLSRPDQRPAPPGVRVKLKRQAASGALSACIFACLVALARLSGNDAPKGLRKPSVLADDMFRTYCTNYAHTQTLSSTIKNMGRPILDLSAACAWLFSRSAGGVAAAALARRLLLDCTSFFRDPEGAVSADQPPPLERGQRPV